MSDYDFDFKAIVEAAKDVIIVTKAHPLDEPGPEIVYVNQAFTDLTGYTRKEVIGKTPRILQSDGTDDATIKSIREALEKQQAIRTTIKNYSKSGREYWLDMSIIPLTKGEGEVTHFAAIERDVTEEKNLELKLEELSKKDELTGLLNRRAFEQMINHEFLKYLRTHNKFSVLLIDLDNFKTVNDNFGHAAGDQALINLSDQFDVLFRSYDHAVRMGGDEFCIVLPDASLVKAMIGAERLRHKVESNPITVDGNEIPLTISIGVAESEENDTDFHEVLERADKALYEAKRKGRNRVQKFKKTISD